MKRLTTITEVKLMTIEKTIQDLTSAIEKLTEVLSQNITDTAPQENPISKKVPKTIEAELVETLIETKKPAKVKVPKAEVVEEVASTEEITIDTIRARTSVFGETKGREATIALLKEFGAAKASGIAPDKRPKYIARLEALLIA